MGIQPNLPLKSKSLLVSVLNHFAFSSWILPDSDLNAFLPATPDRRANLLCLVRVCNRLFLPCRNYPDVHYKAVSAAYSRDVDCATICGFYRFGWGLLPLARPLS